MSGDVLITWRECDCDWITKFCDEDHEKWALVSRSELARLTAARDSANRHDRTEG